METAILESAGKLAEEILESSEYRRFLRAKERVKAEGLEEQVNSLRSRLFFLQLQGPEVYQAQIGALTEQYEELITHLSVKEYLDTEIKICRIMQRVTQILTEGLELDLDFME